MDFVTKYRISEPGYYEPAIIAYTPQRSVDIVSEVFDGDGTYMIVYAGTVRVLRTQFNPHDALYLLCGGYSLRVFKPLGGFAPALEVRPFDVEAN